ncbi:MAG: hypothetical protein M3434_08345, partial [Gemmatimonadota bacterium]|nr:hypothetical protein [Gemmatimonadota bacterium]
MNDTEDSKKRSSIPHTIIHHAWFFGDRGSGRATYKKKVEAKAGSNFLYYQLPHPMQPDIPLVDREY